jgi:hypothetical protein
MHKAVAFTGLLACSSLICWRAKAETALEVQSWCKPFLTATFDANKTFWLREQNQQRAFVGAHLQRYKSIRGLLGNVAPAPGVLSDRCSPREPFTTACCGGGFP